MLHPIELSGIVPVNSHKPTKVECLCSKTRFNHCGRSKRIDSFVVQNHLEGKKGAQNGI